MNNTRDIPKNNPDKGQKRSTIGVLIDYARPMTAGGYQSILWAGISDCAKRQDANLICFSGRALKEPYEFEMQRNVIYGLVDPTNADALILCGGLGNFVSPDEYQRFCERFYPLPIVSIAFSVKGAANVLVDNEKGLREAVAHFVEVHDKTKFAFIRGSRDNLEAEMRFDIFKQVLQDYHLELPDAFIAQGDFLPHTGAEAVQFFFDTQDFLPGEDIQVIFAANDGMALGALEALRERRITIPKDISLVGFDDIPEASLVSPKLTTVRQPLYEQGQRAVQIALDILNGQLHPEPVILQTEFVARQSCGCLPRNVEHVTESMMSYPIPKSSEDKIPDQSRNELQRKISEIFDQVSPKDVSGLAGELLDNFIAEIKGTPSGRFIDYLGNILRNTQWRGDSAELWHQAISILHRCALPDISDDCMALSRADVLLQQARIYIGEMTSENLAFQNLQSEAQAVRLGQINEALSTTFNISELMHVLACELPDLGIKNCYLSLYEKDHAIPSRESHLILAYREGARISLSPEGQIYPSIRLVPENLLPKDRRYSLLVQPLFFKNNHLGFILFEIDLKQHDLYEILRRQISTALQGATLFEERERARQELARSNEDLEQFAYIASHDLKEPLRVVASYIQLLEQKYADTMDEEARQFIHRVLSSVSRMNSLIHDLLSYSRVHTSQIQFQPVDCNRLLKTVLADLKILIDQNDIQISSDELPTVMADRTQLLRVFQNLIDNAIKFKSKRPLQIHIGVEHQVAGDDDVAGNWVFFVRDNGIGIERNHFEKIFKIFQRLHTQKQYHGTGIGLAICKKIVEHHHGRIWVESQYGKGTTFFFSIPNDMALRARRTG